MAVWQALAGQGDAINIAIVRDLRLPRVVLAMLVGCALGSSGAALQGTLRNALAEPYLLGVSGGAAVGAVLALIVGVTATAAVPLAAFGGAVVAVLLVLALARAAGGARDPRTLLMAGVIIGAFANAMILILLADVSPERVRGALWWMAGSLSDASWLRVGWLAVYVLLGVALLVTRGRLLDVLALGDDSAAALGADVGSATRQVFLISALLAAASVSAAGLIGFVGLVVPHVVRRLGGETRSIVTLLVINLVITFAVPIIDWRAHLGGLVTGSVVAAAFVYAPRGERRSTIQGAACAGVGLLVVAAVLVRTAALT